MLANGPVKQQPDTSDVLDVGSYHLMEFDLGGPSESDSQAPQSLPFPTQRHHQQMTDVEFPSLLLDLKLARGQLGLPLPIRGDGIRFRFTHTVENCEVVMGVACLLVAFEKVPRVIEMEQRLFDCPILSPTETIPGIGATKLVKRRPENRPAVLDVFNILELLSQVEKIVPPPHGAPLSTTSLRAYLG